MIDQAKHQKRRKDSPVRRTAAWLLAVVMLLSAVTLGGTGFSFIRVKAADDDGGLSEHVIDTVSPNHVKFNLFDYWVNTRDSSYSNGWEVQKGINQGHVFLFGAGQGSRRSRSERRQV